MTRLRIEDATMSFEDGATAETVFSGFDLSVDSGEFVTVMGPSGCGKTTLLNLIAGLESLTAGRVTLDGSPVVPGESPIGYVFQEPRLLEWRTVAENVDFALRATGVPSTKRPGRIDWVLERVGLADERDAYPLRLSGGQRQRVNLARALAINPTVLLMDEPFSSLDEVTARRARLDLLDVWEETALSVLFVTHNVAEAVRLSDRVICLDAGGDIFHELVIPHDRPRDFDAPELRETEAALTETFFDALE